MTVDSAAELVRRRCHLPRAATGVQCMLSGYGAVLASMLLLLLGLSLAVSQPVPQSSQPLAAPAQAPSSPGPAVPPRSPTSQNRFCSSPGGRCCDECIGDDYYGVNSPYYNENINTCSASGLCLACGQGGERCCPGGKCVVRHTCNASGFCEATCGFQGLPCCTGAENVFRDDGCANPRITCVSGMCTPCGEMDQPCCQDQSPECFGRGRCDEDDRTCAAQACGGTGQPCCPQDEQDLGNGFSSFLQSGCDSETQCVDGLCNPCGFVGTQCCSERSDEYMCASGNDAYFDYTRGVCSDEGICRGGRSIPEAPPPPRLPEESGRACGFLGLRCCPPEKAEIFGGECPGDFQVCTDGICTICGGDGAECCEGGHCFSGTSFCDADGFCSRDCGSQGERCCDGGACRFRGECDTGTNTCVSQACGERGERCCAVTPSNERECESGLDCVNGMCRSCGYEGDPCCDVLRFFGFQLEPRPGPDKCYGDGAVCGPDNTCTGALPFQNIASNCGFNFRFCCPGERCARGTVCEGGGCVRCGSPGEQCCPGGRCEGGGACVDGVCGAKTCGEPGLSCCDIDPTVDLFACSSNSACVDDTCEFCGYYGAPCCDENPLPCFGQGVCHGDTCFSAAEAGPSSDPLLPPAQVPPAPAQPPTAPPPPAVSVPAPQPTALPLRAPTPDDSNVSMKGGPSSSPPPAMPPPLKPKAPQREPPAAAGAPVPAGARSMRPRRPRGQRLRVRKHHAFW